MFATHCYRSITHATFFDMTIASVFSIFFATTGNGGTEGKWGDEEASPECDDGSAICGISVKFETPNYFDETAVGDAVMYCCDD